MRWNSLARVASLGIIALMLCGTPSAMAKTFRINIVADPAQMDPITYSELISGRIMRNMYEGFTATTDDGRNIPALAVRWEPLANGPGFRFFLRKGVLFHSGRTFTAKDVKYTFAELLRPGSKGGLNASYLTGERNRENPRRHHHRRRLHHRHRADEARRAVSHLSVLFHG
jgi:oligopeptide transport system substrate-binding protein